MPTYLSKPSVPRLRWGHPLARGLQFCCAFAGRSVPVDLVSRRPMTVTGSPVWGSGPHGAKWGVTQAGQEFAVLPGAVTVSSATGLTIAMLMAGESANYWTDAAYKPGLEIGGYSSTSGIGLITHTGAAAQGWSAGEILAVGSGFGLAQTPRASAPHGAIAAGQPVLIVAVLSDGVWTLYRDGSPLSKTLNSTGPIVAYTEAQIRLGRNTGGDRGDQSFSLAAVWGRSLSRIEVAALARDPFLMARPARVAQACVPPPPDAASPAARVRWYPGLTRPRSRIAPFRGGR